METTDKITDKVKTKHSGAGIASFVISIISFVITIGCFVTVMYIELAKGGLNKYSIINLIVGVFGIFTFLINIVGVGLGIYGVIEKDRKKIFSVIGLIINIAILLLYLFIMIVPK